jgi:hypothetical protein
MAEKRDGDGSSTALEDVRGGAEIGSGSWLAEDVKLGVRLKKYDMKMNANTLH